MATPENILAKKLRSSSNLGETGKAAVHLFNLTQLRRATTADVKQILALEELCFSYDRMSLASIRRFVTSDQASVWVCGEGGSIDAYIVMLYHSKRSHARLYSLAVHPCCRGQGLGNKLVRFVEQEVSGRGLYEIRLEVKPDNSSALQLYLKAGYQVAGTRPSYYTDGGDATICVKRFTSP